MGEKLSALPATTTVSDSDPDHLNQLMVAAEEITPAVEGESPLDYFERLIASGIKIVLTSGGYYKDALTLADFE